MTPILDKNAMVTPFYYLNEILMKNRKDTLSTLNLIFSFANFEWIYDIRVIIALKEKKMQMHSK
jgi:hypothetical protein